MGIGEKWHSGAPKHNTGIGEKWHSGRPSIARVQGSKDCKPQFWLLQKIRHFNITLGQERGQGGEVRERERERETERERERER